MSTYYNEHDPFAAAWLRELGKAGHIPAGTVDERSIADVGATDLVGATQVHCFAGIGGWPYALRLAGWPDDVPVWTGSCPCQPFSSAGKGRGTDDERHLWPEMRRLIAECRPSAVFGEQVASRAGREWLAAVRADLEALGYVVGAADLCAAGVGAPHIRQRLFWGAVRVDDRHDSGQRADSGPVRHEWHDTGRGREDGRGLGDAGDPGSQRHGRSVGLDGPAGWPTQARHSAAPGGDDRWVLLRDGTVRPVEPGTFPLAHGVPARVGRLRGYGNAIVPQVAALFVRCFMDAVGDVL